MASILKVDTIQDQSGNNIINENADTITIGASGDTITVPSGASMTVPSGGLTGQNYPAFCVKLSANQIVTDASTTKVQFDEEIIDTDNAYDNSTNYRFTVPTGKAGRYFISLFMNCNSSSDTTVLWGYAKLYKNGSLLYEHINNMTNNPVRNILVPLNVIIDLSDGDYLEAYNQINVSSGTPNVESRSFFSGYRIGA
jgi:hypothetical protein